ncbi:SPFH domain-containing protein [Streptomyces sp. 5.8]|uniref:SPFH domain-containing protein n=1 Tax=Streptomyces sp. 5.8 TaxID=3406571 RepID=UPI003BB5FA40
MYPTRTTSTTGTFQIPPHPTPRPTPPSPTEADQTEAERTETMQPEAATAGAVPAEAALAGAAPAEATADAAAPGGALVGAAAPAAAAPWWAAPTEAGWAADGSGAESDPHVSAAPARAESAPAAGRWAAAGAGTERGSHVSAVPGRATPVPDAAGWASAEAGAERGSHLSAAPDGATPVPVAPVLDVAGWASAEGGGGRGSGMSVEHDRAASAPAAGRWVEAGAGTERGSHVSAVPGRSMPVPDAAGWASAEGGGGRGMPSERDRAASVSAAAGWAAAEAGAERGSGMPSEHDRAESAPAAGRWAAAEAGTGQGSYLSAAPDRAASVQSASVPVPSGRVGASVAVASDAVPAEASAPAVPAAAVTEWAAPTGWALAGEQSGSARAEAVSRPAPAGADRDADGLVAVGAAAQATAVAPHGPAGRAGESARSDVPAARAQVEPGVDIPHPQDEAAHAGTATLRLRTPDTESARPHPQDEAWPPAAAPAAVVRTPAGEGPYAAAEHAPRHAGPPAAWDLPGQAGSSAEHGRAPQHAVQGRSPESEYADPHPVRDLPEPADAASADPADPAEGRELTWSVPAPGGSGDGGPPGDGPAEAATAEASTGDTATTPQPETGGGVVPGPGAAEVAEVVARAVARIAEDDTQDLPVVTGVRGVAVTEVPVHLPFRGAAQPQPRQPEPEPKSKSEPEPEPEPNPNPAQPKAKAAPGRRVPRGDDRLHEHRGPVLPGWIAVAVGGIALAGCAVVLWRAGAVPDSLALAFGAEPRPYRGLQAHFWPPLAFLGIVALLALGGLGRGRAGHAWVLTLFGRYRGTVRRSGLTWISPLLLRRRVDVRLRHWRSDPMPAVDSGGLALQVVVQVVWQVKDTARATLAVADHVDYLAEQVESAMARVLSQLPADAFHEAAPTLRDAEAVGDALTRMLAAETEAVGVEVFSAQPTRIEYAPEVADAMRRRRVAAIDAKHRDTVLTSVVDAVDDTVHRLTSRGLVELDDYERKALVKDLTVAFYTGRAE